MDRLGLGSGCVLGLLAVAAAAAALWWPDGVVAWVCWATCVVLVWGTVMSIYAFDRPAPPGAPRT